MAGILLKIAKEFNIATTTIVDFLISKGFEVENKPNAKISDEMHTALAKEFSGSADIKEKADQIQIGTSYKKPEEKVQTPSNRFDSLFSEKPAAPSIPTPPPAPAPAPPVTPPVTTPVLEVEEKTVEEPVQEKAVVEEVVVEQKPAEETPTATPEKVGLKILGKIDLSAKPKKSKPAAETKKETPEKKEAPKPAASAEAVTDKVDPPTQEVITTPAKEIAPTEPSAPEEELHRAKTPQLAGLKILGKIDTNKFGKEGKKPKELEKAKDRPKGGQAPNKPHKEKTLQTANAGGTNANNANAADADKKKRKRKKLVAANSGGQFANKTKTLVKDEVKEVSQKEIDDKIKATMARLNSTGKNKRQKIRRDNRAEKREKQEAQDLENVETKLKLTEFVSVSELASLMDIPVASVITTCMNLGVIVSINQRLDAEIIELVSGEFGFEVEFINAEEAIQEEDIVEDDPAELVPRAPIVTVMGHVDHGKTSLLDYIRKANVVSGEAGGITQHIGAYEVLVNSKKVTFLDTPGHEAFTAMRARGAKLTDVAVIIIAADDQIMPQTREAISHSQAAGVPMIFAINKIDKPGADSEKIRQQLASMNILVEEWGGTYQCQEISAKTGLNIDLLLEKIVLEAEVLELTANPNKLATGTVVEASLDKGRGFTTKLLVQNGTLKMGDPFVAGAFSGKVKAMFNEKGKKLKDAGPSTPVMVLGLSGAPQAGEKFKVMDSEQDTRQLAAKRAQIEREQTNRASKRISLDEIGRRLALGTFKELNLIVKGDVDGSIEALADSLIKLSVETIQVNIIHKAVGQIAESDVLLASASDAIIIGFQVRPSPNARQLAEKEGVQIKCYSIIYEAIEEVKMAMEGMLEPTKEEKILAQVEVRETYKLSKLGTIAGCLVTEGKLTRNAYIRVIRDGIVVFPTKEGAHGELNSLKRVKDDVKEVRNAMECGLTIKNFNDIREGDTIEAYEIIEIKTLLA